MTTISYGNQGNFRENNPAIKVSTESFENLYQLNDEVYRSEQPSSEGMREIEALGIKTVINLRNRMNDRREAKGTKLNLVRLRINTWRMAYQDIVAALILMGKAEKPLLLHCLHGADRTGVIIGAYRMVHDNWSREEAIQEFRSSHFGYHEGWFPKLPMLLEQLDIPQLKRDINFK